MIDFNSYISKINSPDNYISKVNSIDNDPFLQAKQFLGFPDDFVFPNQSQTFDTDPKLAATKSLGNLSQPDINTSSSLTLEPAVTKDSQMLDYYKKQLMFNPNDYENDFFPVIPDVENVSMITPSKPLVVNADGNITKKDKVDSTEKTRRFIPEWMNLVDFGINTLSNNREMNYQKKQQDLNNMITQQPQVVSYNKRQLKGDKAFMKEGGEKDDDKKPIYVSDKKDPRLKAYNDSLRLNKKYPLPPEGYKINPYTFDETGFFVVGKTKKGLDIIESKKTERPKNEPIGFTLHNANKTEKIFNKDTNEVEDTYASERPIYKKPVQPVIYKKPVEDTYEKDLKLYNENKKAYESETGLSYDKLVYDSIKNGTKSNSSIGWTEKNVELFAYRKPVLLTKKEAKVTDFEKRIQNPVETIKNTDGTTSTHKMMSWESDGKYYAAPTVVKKDGKLVELNEDEAIDFAFKNNEYKEFKTDAEAKAYANNGYKKDTPLETKKEPLGTINVEGKSIPYYTQEDLAKFSTYKPTKVGDSNNYTISRFNSPLYFEGDKLYDKNTKKEVFKLGGGKRKLKQYQHGGEYDVDEKEIERLKKLGYDFDIL